MRNIVFALVVLLGAVLCRANDGVYFMAGNQLVPLMETDVSVAREILTITLGDDGVADVDVYYEFFNGGGEKTVVMGFEAMPPYNAGAPFDMSGRHPFIRDFSVVMNGARLSHTTAVCLQDTRDGTPVDTAVWKQHPIDEQAVYSPGLDSMAHYSYVYKFDATFRKGLNIVRHTYSYNMGYGASGLFNLDYKLTPATRWANRRIDDFTLRIKTDATTKHFLVRGDELDFRGFRITRGEGRMRRGCDVKCLLPDGEVVRPNWEFVLRDATLEWHADGFCPKSELYLCSADAPVASPTIFHDPETGKSCADGSPQGGSEFGTFYDRSGRFDVRALYDHSHFCRSFSYDTRLLRSIPYAHRGHVFDDKYLSDFFSSQWWYMPDSTVVVAADDLTDMELDYIRVDDAERRREGRLVTDIATGKALGSLVRAAADSLTVYNGSLVRVARHGKRVEQCRAADGRGVVFVRDGEADVHESPDGKSAAVGRMTDGDSTGRPDMLPCLGYADGWFCVSIGGRRGYVSEKEAAWDCCAILPRGF